ncbi:MAG: GNAT family N-acetyltransferase [Verrucomicrobia bacterium]|nr:GNAT family N-acetyltransferase [Verrucomicrobiota bacterium]
MLPEGFQIRRYLPRDEDAVYEVCLKTGDSGKDGTHLYDDPKALGHIYVGPYIHLEPELAFVLEDKEGVCGYVMGVLDSKKFYQAFVDKWLPGIRQRHPEPTGDPATWTPTQKLYHQYYHPDVFCPEPYDQYPSHLHIDLMPRVQGRGLGNDMMRVLLEELAAQKTPGVHLGMAPSNARAEKFYKKLGFHELLRTSDSLYLGKQFP